MSDVSRFFGRERDLEALSRAVIAARLVTVTGPGGIGKTRLVRRFLASEDRPFVELAQETTLAGVRRAIAAALGVPPDGLEHAFGAGPMVVLDNVEQVVEPLAPAVARWLATTPVRFVATSRERLRIEGELVLDLEPLPSDDGVALFLDRARALDRSFDADPAVIREIVDALDGLPLAIELAAARTRLLSATAVRDRLAERLDLLKDRPRDRTSRQATLRGAIDWSYDLLAPEDQQALVACSAFRGGFDLDAATAVLGKDALDRLDSLRERSLLRRSGDRFTVDENVRLYGMEKIGPEALDRHRGWYLGLGERLAANPTPAALRTLRAEVANLLEIHRRASGDDKARAALVLDALLAHQGPFEELVPLHDAAVESAASPLLKARSLRARANARRQRGDMDGARADLDRALLTDATIASPVLALHGIIERSVGNLGAAEAFFARALEGADDRTRAMVLVELGFLRIEQRRPDEGESLCHEGLALARRVGDGRVEGIALIQLGNLASSRGRFDHAAGLYADALTVARSLDDRRTEGMVLANLALTRMEQGRLDDATSLLETALSLNRRVGNRRFEAIALGYQGLVALERGDLALAASRFGAARTIHDAMGSRRWQAEVRVQQAWLAWAEHRRDDAVGLLREAGDLDPSHGAVVHAALAALGVSTLEIPSDEPTAMALRAWARDRAVPEALFARASTHQELRIVLGLLRADRPAGIEVGAHGAWFRVDGAERIDLSRRRPLQRLLEALAEARRADPGRGLDVAALVAAGWPGERIVESAGRNRVYVAIAELRTLGLGDRLLRLHAGYLLDPAVPLEMRREI